MIHITSSTVRRAYLDGMNAHFEDAAARVRLLPAAQQEAAAAILIDFLRKAEKPPAGCDGRTAVPGRYATAAQIDAVFKSLSR